MQRELKPLLHIRDGEEVEIQTQLSSYSVLPPQDHKRNRASYEVLYMTDLVKIPKKRIKTSIFYFIFCVFLT